MACPTSRAVVMMNCSRPRAAAADFARGLKRDSSRMIDSTRRGSAPVLLRLRRDHVVEVARVEQLAHEARQELGDEVVRDVVARDHFRRVDRQARGQAAAQRFRPRHAGGQRLQGIAHLDEVGGVVEEAHREQEIQTLRRPRALAAEEREARVLGRGQLRDLAKRRQLLVDVGQPGELRRLLVGRRQQHGVGLGPPGRVQLSGARGGAGPRPRGRPPPRARARPAAPRPGDAGRSTRNGSGVSERRTLR